MEISKEIREEVLEMQKEAVLKDVAVLELQLEFKEADQSERESKATPEEKEDLAKQRLHQITPLRQNIEYKQKYYEFLCNK